jgi:hypothetical protein
MGLALAGIPHRRGGVAAAMGHLIGADAATAPSRAGALAP